jgi:hypothetical protein
VVHGHASQAHPALRHKVINSPNPNTPSAPLPDGSTARIVKLGDLVDVSDYTNDMSHWWPTGISPHVRFELMRRISREGNVLPIVTSICLALMLGMYSTTTKKGTKESHRVRLRYRTSPICDFGIVSGSVRVAPEDQLAYVLPDKSVIKGQDPQDHYWIYFRTLKGEEGLLECNLFALNMCLVVDPSIYFDTSFHGGFGLPIPAWFRDGAALCEQGHQPQILVERRRFSVLRDQSLLKALKPVDREDNHDLIISNDSVNTITTFMSRIAGRSITHAETDLCMFGCTAGAYTIFETIQSGKWKNYPAPAQAGFEGNIGDAEDLYRWANEESIYDTI